MDELINNLRDERITSNVRWIHTGEPVKNDVRRLAVEDKDAWWVGALLTDETVAKELPELVASAMTSVHAEQDEAYIRIGRLIAAVAKADVDRRIQRAIKQIEREAEAAAWEASK